jgi:hypothetical protein
MVIGPFPDVLWEIISANARYYRPLGYTSSPSRPPNLQAIARLLLQAEQPDRYAEKVASGGRSFKTDYHRDQIRGFFDGDPEQASIGLKIMRCLHFREADVRRVIVRGEQTAEVDDLRVRFGESADAAEMEHLGRAYLGDRQSPASRIEARIRNGLEHSVVGEDVESRQLRGFLRWWIVAPHGVKQILEGHVLTGGDLRDGDLSVAPRPEGGALYIVMLLGTDDLARFRMNSAALKLVKEYERCGLPTFTRPSTCIGLKMVKRRSRAFHRVGHVGSRIFVRQPRISGP